MPFTLAHPAAVLPLMRPPFSAVALVAGAVAADMPYFARSMGIVVSAQSWYEPFLNATTAHSLRGMVTIDVVYALALCGLTWVARRPIRALLPALAGTGNPRADDPRALLVRGCWVLLSLLIGIATHLVWDSFTHGDSYLVARVSWLSSPLVADLTWARALQHVSTVAGLVAIAVYLWRRRCRLTSHGAAQQEPADRRRRLVVLVVIGAVVIAGAIANAANRWASADALSTGQVVEGVLSDGAKGAGAALISALLLFTAAWWIRRGVVTVRAPR